MIRKIKHILGFGEAKSPTTDFSDFFHRASSSEKKKLLEEVVREANKDQRDLVSRYNATKSSPH